MASIRLWLPQESTQIGAEAFSARQIHSETAWRYSSRSASCLLVQVLVRHNDGKKLPWSFMSAFPCLVSVCYDCIRLKIVQLHAKGGCSPSSTVTHVRGAVSRLSLLHCSWRELWMRRVHSSQQRCCSCMQRGTQLLNRGRLLSRRQLGQTRMTHALPGRLQRLTRKHQPLLQQAGKQG